MGKCLSKNSNDNLIPLTVKNSSNTTILYVSAAGNCVTSGSFVVMNAGVNKANINNNGQLTCTAITCGDPGSGNPLTINNNASQQVASVNNNGKLICVGIDCKMLILQ